jgi:hypothetical protein
MMKRLFALSGLLLLTACSGNTTQSTRAPDGGLPATYRSPDGFFSVRHADGWGVEQNHEIITDEYELTGTALLVPVDRTETTLYEGIFHIARVDICPEQSRTTQVSMNGLTWNRSEWEGAGAGNLYEGETYTTDTMSGCLVVTMYAHSCNLSPEECGPTKPEKYDRGALFGTMHQMLETLKLL